MNYHSYFYYETKDGIILSFDDNKRRFGTKVSSWVWLSKMIFKVTITKINQNKRKKIRKRRPQREEPSKLFIKSLRKVVGALDFTCILFKHQRSSLCNFVLNFFIIG